MRTRIQLLVLVLLGLVLGPAAQAYYNPSTGRWLNCHACPPFLVLFPKEEWTQSECKAYKALFDCLAKFRREDPQPLGYYNGMRLIQSFLDNNPGKCKQFPGDSLPFPD